MSKRVPDAAKHGHMVQFNSEEAQVAKDLKAAQDKAKEFKRLIHESVKVQDEVKDMSLKLNKQLKELKALAQRTKDKEDKVRMEKRIAELKDGLIVLRETRPETRSMFSRLFLGRVNVKMWSYRDRERLRDEYNKFRLRTGIIFTLFPCIVLTFHYYLRHQWRDTQWINIIHQLWLLYYYISLALRENILLANGSNIRWWWIRHHYVAALATTVYLTWPPTPIYLHYLPQFTFLALFQGFVQLLQLWYQGAREYANRALGKTGHLDISYSETITEFPKELFILVPFLFLANAWMIYLGYSLLWTFVYECNVNNTHWTEFREELQVVASGILALVMGIGNLIATADTIYVKARGRTVEQRKKRA